MMDLIAIAIPIALLIFFGRLHAREGRAIRRLHKEIDETVRLLRRIGL